MDQKVQVSAIKQFSQKDANLNKNFSGDSLSETWNLLSPEQRYNIYLKW